MKTLSHMARGLRRAPSTHTHTHTERNHHLLMLGRVHHRLSVAAAPTGTIILLLLLYKDMYFLKNVM